MSDIDEDRLDLIQGLREQGVKIEDTASNTEIMVQYQRLYNIAMYKIGQLK